MDDLGQFIKEYSIIDSKLWLFEHSSFYSGVHLATQANVLIQIVMKHRKSADNPLFYMMFKDN